ncbi:MAG: hypothetical protein KGO47_10075 [Cyanobacteria bacterium REEB417]|nr:hypothetical protein [Cyanobacteria bacterium REEB417]
MSRSSLGIGIALVGIALLFVHYWVVGIVLLLIGIGILNGAQHDVWISFNFGDSNDSDGGGDGDGGCGGD